MVDLRSILSEIPPGTMVAYVSIRMKDTQTTSFDTNTVYLNTKVKSFKSRLKGTKHRSPNRSFTFSRPPLKGFSVSSYLRLTLFRLESIGPEVRNPLYVGRTMHWFQTPVSTLRCVYLCPVNLVRSLMVKDSRVEKR